MVCAYSGTGKRFKSGIIWIRDCWSVRGSASQVVWLFVPYCCIGGRYIFLSFTRSLADFDGLALCGQCGGRSFCWRYALPFSLVGGLAITSVFQIWGRKTKEAEDSGFRYLFFHVSSGLLLLAGILFRYHGEGSSALSLESLTDALEGGDIGAMLILVAIGIKAAFPGLHVWLKDGYAEATHTGPVWLCAFTTKCAVCMLARLFPGAEILITIGGVMAMFPIFYAVIENDLRRVLCYSKINQIGFMVVGIGIGTDLAIDGAIAHAFTHVLYKGLLFMSMGAVLYRTGEIRGSHLGVSTRRCHGRQDFVSWEPLPFLHSLSLVALSVNRLLLRRPLKMDMSSFGYACFSRPPEFSIMPE